MIVEIKKRLSELTGKKNIILTRRGNKALKFILKALKEKGLKKIVIQDQGGWITYPQYAKELGFELVEIKTDYGISDLKDLESKADSSSILLINSMPGYIAYEDMDKIAEIAKRKKSVLVNDVSGSIGSANAKIGDIIFGSFGHWKPIDLGYGGFIADDSGAVKIDSVFDLKWEKGLLEKIAVMEKRVGQLKELSSKTKKDLSSFEIIHREAGGFNVAVKFRDDAEKEKIINYCAEKKLEWAECPRYIRVNEKAICIEVKRRETDGD